MGLLGREQYNIQKMHENLLPRQHSSNNLIVICFSRLSMFITQRLNAFLGKQAAKAMMS